MKTITMHREDLPENDHQEGAKGMLGKTESHMP